MEIPDILHLHSINFTQNGSLTTYLTKLTPDGLPAGISRFRCRSVLLFQRKRTDFAPSIENSNDFFRVTAEFRVSLTQRATARRQLDQPSAL